MSIARQIKKLHNISDVTLQKRLLEVRKHFGLRDYDEVSLEQYLEVFKR